METNKILLTDAYESIKSIPSKSIDLIITDPPYEIEGIHNSGLLKDRINGYHMELLNSNLGKGIDYSILDEFVRVMKKINVYIWCNKEQIYGYLSYFLNKYKCNWEMIIWYKTNPPPFTSTHYLKDKEYCLYFWETGVELKPTFESGKTVYISPTNKLDKNDYLHPTIKDIYIIENFVKNSSKEKDLVFDPFVGSGTICLAAKHLNRNYLGFEINPDYYEIAVKRLNGENAKGELNLFDISYD